MDFLVRASPDSEIAMRLLVLSCSQRKRPDAGLLPAIERYDGPLYRVLRRFLREQPTAALDIRIVSARFGLVAPNDLIPAYDQKMTLQHAEHLRPAVSERLTQLLNSTTYNAVCFAMGKTYYTALEDYARITPERGTCTHINGTIGKMLADLHDWLYGKPATDRMVECIVSPQQAPPRIRGIEISLTSEQVFARARQALTDGCGDPTRYHAWYVDLDGQRVSPKWLVSQITGLSPGSFHSDEARNLLSKLGIVVHPIH
jgi:hypothetical protein